MKKIFVVLLIMGTFFLLSEGVKAESFIEGNFISGEYINKVKDKKTYYMTMQYIKDSQGRIVYCLEPFVDFKTGQSYVEYSGDLASYNKLSKEQKRKIELIVYYGYGYNDRREDKWYVVTQYLIWKVVDGSADIYFTNKLNGTRISKYEYEANEIMNDVLNHDNIPEFIKKYEVNYGDTLKISNVGNDYKVNNLTYDSFMVDNDLILEGILNDGQIGFQKKSNYYSGNVVIYDSSNSQDLIRPGNVNNPEYFVDIQVNKGNLNLDIRDDDSVYTIESDFTDTCYEITKDDRFVDKVCTNDKSLIYKTIDLPYGDYKITQTSVGIGYKRDINVYNITINKENEQPKIILYNKLIKNDIEIIKYACKNDLCAFEKDAMFEIRDIKGDLVETIKTKENGYANYTVGYGKYNIYQVSGISGYTIADVYTEKIVDEISLHKKELYNYYIEEEKPSLVVQEEETVEDVILPPKTNTDYDFNILICGFLFTLFISLKKMCF